MLKLPREARPVAEFIRKNLPRPTELPEFVHGSILRWTVKNRSISDLCEFDRNEYCPLGLLPCAIGRNDERIINCCQPISIDSFTEGDAPGTDHQIEEFYNWWDHLKEEDALNAVNAIWGEPSTKKKGIKHVVTKKKS